MTAAVRRVFFVALFTAILLVWRVTVCSCPMLYELESYELEYVIMLVLLCSMRWLWLRLKPEPIPMLRALASIAAVCSLFITLIQLSSFLPAGFRWVLEASAFLVTALGIEVTREYLRRQGMADPERLPPMRVQS